MSNVEKYVPPNNNSNEQTVEKLGNEVYIQAGNYCRPFADVEAKVRGDHSVIKAGEVLLIQQLKYAHDLIHAVVVRPHPRYFKDGNRPSFYSFLFEDFLDKFEIMSMQEGNAIRTKEMQELQNYISDQQKELFEIQCNPQRMMQIAMDIYSRRIEHKTEDQFIPTGDNLNVVDVIEAGVSPALINQIKASTNKQRDIAQIQAQWLTDQQKRLQDMFAAVLPYGTEMAAAQTSSIQDVTDSIDKMMSGIATLELYTGEDVFVYTVKEGEPAPDGLPLTVMQERLYGDVELSLFTEKAVKLDYRNRHLLWDEFKTNQAFVDQVFPTERCIVLMCCNRNSKDYGNAYENASRNHDNKEVFLLVRNGENIHAVYSSISTHLHSSRLFPSKVELERHFYNESKKIVIDINDLKYSDRLSQVEAEALHYRRFMILIAGLDHREKLFGNFYPAQSPLNIFYPEFQNKYMNFIHDIDGEGMLPTQEEKRPSLFEFLMQSNSQIRKGSRIVVQTHLLLNQYNAPACFSYKKGEYECNYFPDEEYLFANVEKDSKGFFIKVPVHPKWNTKKRSFNARFAIPVNLEPETLLCIDYVSPADLEFYITSRVHRHHFLRYLEMFKAARQYIANQHDSLKEVRYFLEDAAQHVPDSRIKDKAEQAKIIRDVMNAWICANNGKVMLDKDGKIGKDTQTALLNQLYFRMSNKFVQRYESLVEKALSSLANQTPLKLAVDFDGMVWLYTTIAPESQINAIEPNRFVARHQLNMGAKARTSVKKTLFVLPDQYSIDEYVIKQWDELESVLPFNKKNYELNGRTRNYLFKDYESKQNFTKYVQMGQDLLQKFYSNSFTIDDAEMLIDAYFAEYKRQHKNPDYGYASPRLYFPFFSLYSNLYVVSITESLDLVYALVNKFNLYEYVEDNCGYTLAHSPEKITYSLQVRCCHTQFGESPDRHIVREYPPQYELKTMLADHRTYTVFYTNSSYEGGKKHGLLSYIPYQVSVGDKIKFDNPETLANIYTSLNVNLLADYENLSLDRAFNNPLLKEGMAFRSSSFIIHSFTDPETKEIKSSRVYILVGSSQDYSKNYQAFRETHDMTNRTKDGENLSVYSRYGFLQYDEIEEHWEKQLMEINKAFFSNEKHTKAFVEKAGLTSIRNMKIIQEDENFLALST